jgi:hypothetical protein
MVDGAGPPILELLGVSTDGIGRRLGSSSKIERLWSGADGEPMWVPAIDGRPYATTRTGGRPPDGRGLDARFVLSPADVRELLRYLPRQAVRDGLAPFPLDTVPVVLEPRSRHRTDARKCVYGSPQVEPPSMR